MAAGVEHAGPHGGGVGVVGVRVPGAEDDLVEGGQGHEVLDAGDVVVGALADADGAELGEGADGDGLAPLGQLDAGDQRGGDGAEADAEDAELAVGGGDGRGRGRGGHGRTLSDRGRSCDHDEGRLN